MVSVLSRVVLAAAIVVGGSGCATYTDKTERMRAAMSAGDLNGALDQTNAYLKLKRPDELPDSWEKNVPLVVLERATILHALGDYDDSITNLQAAENQLELLDLSGDAAGNVAKYIWSDASTKYKTPPVEKLSLNALNMLNYLAKGDLEGARVEAKRFTTMRNYLREYDPEHAYGGFGSYLAGFTMERLGETASALRYYEEALEERTLPSLIPTLRRIWRPEAYASERFETLLGTERISIDTPAAEPTSGGELLVVVNVGRVPYKEARRIPIGAAIGIAGTYITGDTAVLERTALKVLIYPELVPAGNAFETASVTVDGVEVYTELVSDVAGHVLREYTELKPKLMGAAISRLIVRALAAEGARAAGSQAKNNGALIGLLASLAVEGAMVAADKPDTRSWTSLPGKVLMARGRFPAGAHEVEVTVQGPNGKEVRRMEVNISDGGFVVLDVTTLR